MASGVMPTALNAKQRERCLNRGKPLGRTLRRGSHTVRAIATLPVMAQVTIYHNPH